MIAGRVASSVVQRQVKHVATVSASAARGPVAAVYEQVAEDMRLVIPPAMLHSASPDVLAAYWTLMREPLIAGGHVDRGTKEAVAAAVSVANICPYCVDMHSVGMYDLATEHDAEAVAADRADDIADPRLREVVRWARTAHQPGADAALPGWVGAGGAAELVGIAVGFHYLGRMVNVFLSNFLLPPGLSPRSRRRVKQGLSRILRPTLREDRVAGLSLPLLPDAPEPPDAAWARGNPFVAAAVARSYRVFELAGHRSVSPVARETVLRRLHGWDGAETGLSTEWCEDLVAPLEPADRAAARLGLLTALSSHQVGDEVIGEFRRYHQGDDVLVDAAAWASFAAARLIGARQTVPGGGGQPPERREERPGAARATT